MHISLQRVGDKLRLRAAQTLSLETLTAWATKEADKEAENKQKT